MFPALPTLDPVAICAQELQFSAPDSFEHGARVRLSADAVLRDDRTPIPALAISAAGHVIELESARVAERADAADTAGGDDDPGAPVPHPFYARCLVAFPPPGVPSVVGAIVEAHAIRVRLLPAAGIGDTGEAASLIGFGHAATKQSCVAPTSEGRRGA